jgi:hypothetical protein
MLDAYRDLIDELLGAPSEVRGLVGDAGADVPAEARRLVAEMRQRDEAVTRRLNTILREDEARLDVLESAAVEFPDSAAELLSGFDAARGELVSLLMNLTLKDWERTATHDVDGEVSLADEVERHVEFDEDHLRRLRAALAAG